MGDKVGRPYRLRFGATPRARASDTYHSRGHPIPTPVLKLRHHSPARVLCTPPRVLISHEWLPTLTQLYFESLRSAMVPSSTARPHRAAAPRISVTSSRVENGWPSVPQMLPAHARPGPGHTTFLTSPLIPNCPSASTIGLGTQVSSAGVAS